PAPCRPTLAACLSPRAPQPPPLPRPPPGRAPQGPDRPLPELPADQHPPPDAAAHRSLRDLPAGVHAPDVAAARHGAAGDDASHQPNPHDPTDHVDDGQWNAHHQRSDADRHSGTGCERIPELHRVSALSLRVRPGPPPVGPGVLSSFDLLHSGAAVMRVTRSLILVVLVTGALTACGHTSAKHNAAPSTKTKPAIDAVAP